MSTRTEKPVGKDLMIYDAAEDAVRILNPTARLVYEAAKGGAGVEAIEARIRGAFAVPADRDVAADVVRLLEDLKGQGLL